MRKRLNFCGNGSILKKLEAEAIYTELEMEAKNILLLPHICLKATVCSSLQIHVRKIVLTKKNFWCVF